MPHRIMKRVAVLGVVLALALCGTAQAGTTIIEPVGSHLPYQRWIDESQVPTPDVTIEVFESGGVVGCPPAQYHFQVRGCALLLENQIWIAVPEVPDSHPREAFMHEIGHFFDADDMPEWARERFDAIYGLGGPWMLLEAGQMTAGEWFAEAYAQCSVKSYVKSGEIWELGEGPIDGSEPLFGMRVAHNKACRMIQNL